MNPLWYRSGRAALVLAAASALGACASKSYLVLLEDPAGGVGRVLVSGKGGQQTVEQARYAVDLEGSKPAQPVDARRFEEDFGAVLAARPVLPQRYLLYFESGGAALTPDSHALLARILDDVKGRPVADVAVIGHTDTVGAAETNEALALQRAQAVAQLLTEQGLQPYALGAESHGERDLLVPTPDETDEPRNRRVEVLVR